MKKNKKQNRVFLTLDIGTSAVKCALIDDGYTILFKNQREFPMIERENNVEVDFELFYAIALDLIQECLSALSSKDISVEALLISSQAQTFTAVDSSFSPLCNGIVWLDERAEKQADSLFVQLSEFSKSSGFYRPLSVQYIAKLLWLKENESNIYKKAKAFPLINEYLVYKLTGKFYSDKTSFAMGGMYDFRTGEINRTLLTILGLSERYFPTIDDAAKRFELISPDIRRKWEVNSRFPVVLCGNDQGASACGAGLHKTGDVNINFGTAMVIYTITDKLIVDLTVSQISGKHPVGNNFFLLNVESNFGLQIRRLKNKYFAQETYDELFKTYLRYTDAEPVIVGEQDLPDIHSAEEIGAFCSGVIKNYLNKLIAHLQQIKTAAQIDKLSLSGGMTNSTVWLNIMEKTLPISFTVNNNEDAGLIGVVQIYLSNQK